MFDHSKHVAEIPTPAEFDRQNHRLARTDCKFIVFHSGLELLIFANKKGKFVLMIEISMRPLSGMKLLPNWVQPSVIRT